MSIWGNPYMAHVLPSYDPEIVVWMRISTNLKRRFATS